MPNLRSTRFLAAVLFAAAFSVHAQTHRVDAPESVVRSIGVYEWTGDLARPDAARLVPVSLFIDGAYKDGGSYYARPVPLALLGGNIYSLEKAGIPQGTVTLDYARHLQTATSGSEDTAILGWFGYGTFAAMPVARKGPVLHAAAKAPVIVSSADKDDDRPTFVNKSHDAKASGTPASDSRTSPPATTASTTPADDDPDRPHFSKDKAPATTPSQTPTTPSPSTPTPSTKPESKEDTSPVIIVDKPAEDSDRPTLRRRDPKQAEADRKARDRSGVVAMGSLNDDPDRPNMRRGKTAGIGGAPSAQLSGIPADLHQTIAVSDPANRQPHPFTRDWATPAERADTLAKLEAIAQQQLANYVRTNGAELPPPPAPKPSARPAVRTRRPAPVTAAPPASFSNEQLTPYTLSYGGLPTFVYTATSPAPSNAAINNSAERYVTLVAQQVPSGELQVAFSSVTDAAHLDRTPWFRLVDAVDPDAGHRASLLFELRAHSGRQFALYRILSAKAEQIFVTNPTD